MKYITYKDPDLGPVLFAFSGNLSHAHVAKCLGVREVRSAGFICRTSDGIYCHGHSQSLGVGSLVSDSKLATAFFL